MKDTLLLIVIFLSMTSTLYAETQNLNVGSLIKMVIAGEDFVGQELIISGTVLSDVGIDSGLINLGTQDTYRSSSYVNFVSIYESKVALRKGTRVKIRVKVEKTSNNKINGTDHVIIDTVFLQCQSCKK